MDRRGSPGPARGVLGWEKPDGEVVHRRLVPTTSLAPFIAHFWWVAWALEQPFVTETLPHPTTHLVFEWPARRLQIVGVASKRFVRTLEGRACVFGIKFRPAMFQALAGGSMTRFANRTTDPIELDARFARLSRRLEKAETLETSIAVAEPFLQRVLEADNGEDPEARELRDLVERIETDRDILRVEDVARLLGVQVRTLERRFRRYVGASPKWVIRRYRLIEAAEQLARPSTRTLARVAAELGYFDQAHFVRDFKALVGRNPSDFVRRARRPLPPGPRTSGPALRARCRQ